MGNSQANRLTPWSNDPFPTLRPKWFTFATRRRGTSGPRVRAWWAAPAASGTDQGTRPTPTSRDELTAELTVFVPVSDPVKLLRLRVTNRGDRVRTLSATLFAEWVLGTTREQTAPFIVTEIDGSSGASLRAVRSANPVRRLHSPIQTSAFERSPATAWNFWDETVQSRTRPRCNAIR